MDKSKFVAIYVRVSSTRQAEGGYSLEAQEKVLRDEIARQGKKVFKVYKDAGISGYTMERPGLQAMLNDAKEGLFGSVGVWMISRLSRKLANLLVIFDEFQRENIQLFSFTEKFDLNTPVGKFTAQMFGSIAQMQREALIENVLNGSKKKAKAGKVVGGKLFGYDSIPDTDDPKGTKKLVIVPREAKAVRKVFDLYLQGYGFKSIAQMLNADGYRGSKGSPFSIMSIKRILDSKVYAGMVKYCGEYYQGIHEPIVSIETWEKAQAMLATKTHCKRIVDYRYLLSGLVKCPACGTGMIPAHVFHKNKNGTERRYYYYSCNEYNNRGTGNCKPNLVKAKEADEVVLAFLYKYLCKDIWLNKVIEEVQVRLSVDKSMEDKIESLKSNITKLNAKRDKLLLAFEEGRLSTEQLLEEDNAIQEAIEEVELDLNRKQFSEVRQAYSEEEIRAAFKLLPKLLEKATDEEKIKLLRGVIKAVYVDEDRFVKTIEVYIPNVKQNGRLQTMKIDIKESR
ncbi:MAG: recombinase family protein [Phascolarctobacterium sp.]|nr:recombinase family protein [Phascolarctobacterium sp.]